MDNDCGDDDDDDDDDDKDHDDDDDDEDHDDDDDEYSDDVGNYKDCTQLTSCSHLPALSWQKHSHLPSLCLPCNHHCQQLNILTLIIINAKMIS